MAAPTPEQRLEQAIGRIYSVVNAIEEAYRQHACPDIDPGSDHPNCGICILHDDMQEGWRNWVRNHTDSTLPAKEFTP